MSKKYSSAPLPFQGQKRRFTKHLKEVLKQYPDNVIFVDLFGGSGLLSHIVKCEKPKSTVIYNDFDNFKQRLNHISETNKLLQELRDILVSYPRKQRITEPYKSRIINILKSANNKGFVDWITISASLLFSGSYATSFEQIRKETFYNNIRVSDYSNSDDYLEGIEVASCNYKELLDKYKNKENVVFLVDPPYLSTDTTTYSSNKYWKLTDYLDVLNAVNGTNYIYFTSSKSNIVELCEWFETSTIKGNPFKGSERIDIDVSVNKQSKYTDTMLFNWCTTSTNDV